MVHLVSVKSSGPAITITPPPMRGPYRLIRNRWQLLSNGPRPGWTGGAAWRSCRAGAHASRVALAGAPSAPSSCPQLRSASPSASFPIRT